MPADSAAPAPLSPEALPELPELPGVSYIMPVLNEGEHIEAAVRTILAQEYDGEKEIVLALGPSEDETNAVVAALAAEDPRVRTVDNPAGDTPSGLNRAIALTRHPVIIRVDAHSELTPDYTETGIATLRRTGAANLGGLMLAKGRTPFQRAVARAYLSPAGLGGPAYHSGDEAQESESAYLGVFRREVFDVLGGFDETLRRGQDWELNLRIREAGGLVWFDPQLEVTYWPRGTWTKLAKQFYATGIWRAEIVRRHPSENSVRYYAPPAFVAAAAVSAAVGAVQAAGGLRAAPAPVKLAAAAVHAPVAVYAAGVGALAATAKGADTAERAWFAAVLPTMHFCWGAGFLRGVVTGAGDVRDRSR